MLNNTEKFVVYLDPDTLHYMYISHNKIRNYPVMNQLYTVLSEGFINNHLVTPISYDHLIPYIKENQVDRKFLEMMGGIGQIQFLQRFTVKTLQLIRIINSFYNQNYMKPVWQDAFTTNPDERYVPGFNKYTSLGIQTVLRAVERERKLSQTYEFIEGHKNQISPKDLAVKHFKYLLDNFSDLINPHLPIDGTPESHLKKFLDFDDIVEIPEFNIISNILFSIFDAYNFTEIEKGMRDDLLSSSESISAYMPYCHFYVTKVDIAEIISMNGLDRLYEMHVYDHNESSLYKLISDITESIKIKKTLNESESKKTIFRRGFSGRQI